MVRRLNLLLTRAWFYTYTGALYASVGMLILGTLQPSFLHLNSDKAHAQTVRQAPPPPPEITIISGKPSRILIPRLGINIDILDGNYNPSTNEWTLSENKAYFAIPSQYPNDYRGNTLIYGHNNKLVFSKLDQLVAGDTMQIMSANGHIFSYIFEVQTVVPPNNLDIFSYSGPPVVTVQTCSGSWYQNRSLYRFNLDEVDG